MTSFSDNFDRANGALGSNWTDDSSLNALAIFSNQVRANSSATLCAAVVNTATATFAADHSAQCVLSALGTGDWGGVTARWDATAGNGYAVLSDGFSDGSRRILRYAAGTSTVIGTVNLTVVNGDTVKIGVVGTTISAYVNGVLINAVTDATYSTGQPGIAYLWSNSRVSRIDNFSTTDSAAGYSKNTAPKTFQAMRMR